MRALAFCSVLALGVGFHGVAHADLKLPRASPSARVFQSFGVTDVTVTYARPGVKGRPIWGALVPYDKVWRTGANDATVVEFSTDVMVQGQKLAAGRYSLHTIPNATEWTVIFNTVAEQWGSYGYDEKNDALRVKVAPAEGPHTEWMSFAFTDAQNKSAKLELAWEKVRVVLNITADTDALVLKSIAENAGKLDDWRAPFRVADYAFTNNVTVPDVTKWLDRSIAIKENFYNVALKARMLAKDGKNKDALAEGAKAVKLGKAAKENPADIEALEKQMATWKAGKK
jgi:hypothetical protein